MSFITYDEFLYNVRRSAFPDGEAEEMVTTHNAYIQDALINLQTFVPCLADNNVEFYSKADLQEWCNVDFVTVPRGEVAVVYAFKPDKVCRKLFFIPKSLGFINCWIDEQRCVTCGDQDEPDDISRSPLCNDMVYGDYACGDDGTNVDESDCAFKNSRRYFAVGPNNSLMVAPRLPCGYSLAVHWMGIKYKYESTDPLPDDIDLQQTVVKQLLAQRALFQDHDPALYDRIMHPINGEFTVARSQMIHRCTRERRIKNRLDCVGGFDVVSPFFDPLPRHVRVILDTGGMGILGTDGSGILES